MTSEIRDDEQQQQHIIDKHPRWGAGGSTALGWVAEIVVVIVALVAGMGWRSGCPRYKQTTRDLVYGCKKVTLPGVVTKTEKNKKTKVNKAYAFVKKHRVYVGLAAGVTVVVVGVCVVSPVCWGVVSSGLSRMTLISWYSGVIPLPAPIMPTRVIPDIRRPPDWNTSGDIVTTATWLMCFPHR